MDLPDVNDAWNEALSAALVNDTTSVVAPFDVVPEPFRKRCTCGHAYHAGPDCPFVHRYYGQCACDGYEETEDPDG